MRSTPKAPALRLGASPLAGSVATLWGITFRTLCLTNSGKVMDTGGAVFRIPGFQFAFHNWCRLRGGRVGQVQSFVGQRGFQEPPHFHRPSSCSTTTYHLPLRSRTNHVISIHINLGSAQCLRVQAAGELLRIMAMMRRECSCQRFKILLWGLSKL